MHRYMSLQNRTSLLTLSRSLSITLQTRLDAELPCAGKCVLIPPAPYANVP